MNNSSSSKKTIFDELGINDDYQRYKVLFADNHNDKENVVQRIKFVLLIYQKWIKSQRENKDNMINMNIYDIICNELGTNYGINSYLKDFRFVVHSHRDSFGCFDPEKEEKKEDDDLMCDIDECYIINRHNRNKGDMTKNNGKRKEMFFISLGNIDDDDAERKCVVIQQLMDTLHCWIYHTVRICADKYISNNIDKNKDNEWDQGGDESVGIDVSCIDESIKKFDDLIKKTTASSKRFRASTDSRYNINNNKFITTNNYQNSNNAEMFKMEEKEDDFVPLWMDGLFEAVLKYRLDSLSSSECCLFLKDEEYETDSFFEDVLNEESSNIVIKFGDYKNKYDEKLKKLFEKLIFEYGQNKQLYSPGFRYFYWEFYKYYDKEWNTLYTKKSGRPWTEGNAGYAIKDWYINKKYIDFKTEMLSNKFSPFSLSQE